MNGKRFMDRLPRFIGEISDMVDLFQAEDKEFENVDRLVADFTLSLVATTIGQASDPNFFIRLLEKDYGLEPVGSRDDRISSILTKIKGQRTTTVEVILEVTEAFGYRAEYIPLYEEYTFKLSMLDGRHFGPEFLASLATIKPAHLAIEFEFRLRDILELRDTTRTYLQPLYITGSDRHKTGTIYENQIKGVKTRDTILIPDSTSTPAQYVPKTDDPKTGQVWKFKNRGGSE